MLLFALLSLSTSVTPAQDTTPKQPLVAAFAAGAFEFGPYWWGSSPWFVLYDDGTIIARTHVTIDSVAFSTAVLSPAEATALWDSLRLIPEFFQLNESYNNVPAVSDLNMYTLWVWGGDSAKEVTLTGMLDSTSILARMDVPLYRSQTPRVFLNAYLFLEAYQLPNPQPWSPPRYEVVLSEFPYAANREAWPQGWPAWEEPGAYLDRRGDYHLPLEPSQALAFARRFGRESGGTGFTLNGKVWVGALRPLLPGDRLWSP